MILIAGVPSCSSSVVMSTSEYLGSLCLSPSPPQVQRILGCGSALERNPVLQRHIEEIFSLPLLLTAVDAAKGAALASFSQSPATPTETH